MAAAFYQNLFLAQENTDPTLVTRAVPRKVTDEMNSALTTAYSQEEVKKALFMMHLISPQDQTVSLLVFTNDIGN